MLTAESTKSQTNHDPIAHMSMSFFAGRKRKLDAVQRLKAGLDAYYTGEYKRIMAEYGIGRSHLYGLRTRAKALLKNPFGMKGHWTKIDEAFIHSFVLLEHLECQASHEDIRITARKLFNYNLTPEKLSTMLFEDALKSIDILDGIDLSSIKAIAADEIFFGDTPVFTIIDLKSTYVLAIIPMDDRKADTWKKVFEDLKKRGLNPDIAISDACGSLLKAMEESFPECNIQYDVFHALMNLGTELRKVTRKATSALQELCDLEERLSGPRPWETTYEKWNALQQKLNDVLNNADCIDLLMDNLKEVLDYSGYSEEEVEKLVNWILDCLSERTKGWNKVQKQIEAFRKNLSDHTLRYLRQFFTNLDKAAKDECFDPATLRAVYYLRRYSGAKRDEERVKLEESSGYGPAGIFAAERLVEKVIRETPRASSLVENLNSRVRVSINAQRGTSEEACYLLTLYINTRPYPRSSKKERVGKSPYELMTDKKLDFFDVLGVEKPTQYSLNVAG